MVAGGEDAVADPVGPEHLGDLADLLAPDLAALLADVDRDAEARLARRLDVRSEDLRVVVAPAARPRAGDVDPDDAARRIADRLLDDHLVLPAVNVRSIIRIRPARTCGYSRLARSSPRIAAMMMWSRSRSPPRFRFIGLKRSSSVVIPCER